MGLHRIFCKQMNKAHERRGGAFCGRRLPIETVNRFAASYGANGANLSLCDQHCDPSASMPLAAPAVDESKSKHTPPKKTHAGHVMYKLRSLRLRSFKATIVAGRALTSDEMARFEKKFASEWEEIRRSPADLNLYTLWCDPHHYEAVGARNASTNSGND